VQWERGRNNFDFILNIVFYNYCCVYYVRFEHHVIGYRGPTLLFMSFQNFLFVLAVDCLWKLVDLTYENVVAVAFQLLLMLLIIWKKNFAVTDCWVLTYVIVVWPTVSCFADWSKCCHVTLIIIEWSTHHGQPRVIIMINGHVTIYHYNDTWSRDVH